MSAGQTIVKVNVYYESLCGDSIRWIKEQLVPGYPSLKEHLKITLIPYGKATVSDNEEYLFFVKKKREKKQKLKIR